MSDSRVTAAGWVLCALATLLAALTPSAAQEDTDDDAFVRQLYSGAALMYSLPALTLVYPAGPGEDRELNRISAERRAAYLRGRHATETRVVADVDFSSEHHDDNLLVIGWNNRLLERADGFERDAEGWNFVGVEHGYDRDLLFEWYSPYNPEREFVFWSRIDPELDRYLQLPFFGSDWVVFDAYFVERFGRFDKDRPTWPPVRNEDLEVDNRPRRLKPLLAGTSKHYELYDLDGNLLEVEQTRILEAREAAWRAATGILGTPEEGARIRLHVYRDSEHKEEVSFVHEARHHMPASGELHLTKIIALDPNPHEDVHLIARRLYGPGYLTALVEGVAVWVEQRTTENELPVYASMLLERSPAPTVASLLDEETMRVLTRNRMGFTFAGLLVTWLREEFGEAGLRKAFGQYSSDSAEMAGRLGLEPQEMERRFANFLLAQAALGKEEATFRSLLAEVNHFTDLGDYERAIPVLARVVELRPDHLLSRYRLALLNKELDRFDSARELLVELLAKPAITEDAGLHAWVWLQLGQVYGEMGSVAEAGAALQNVLELPDYQESHAKARQELDRGGS